MKALDGIKVLDFSQGAAGPYASMLLGDFGAEICKVEPPQGDWGRTLGPPFIEGEAATFLSLNRNKRSLVLDLKSQVGKDVARKLAEKADVVVESFRPGVMEKLGLGYENLKKLNPRVVYCSISGFGQQGPWKNKPGVDGIIQAVSGFMSVTGFDEMSPIKAGTVVADMMGGILASYGVLIALLARDKTGEGQKVDQSLLDAMLTIQSAGLGMYFASGQLPKRMGSQAPYAVPNGAFPTQDGHIMVAANLQPKWVALCKLLNKDDWIEDTRFHVNTQRVQNRNILIPLLEEIFKTKNTADWLELLENSDILCAPITTYEDVVNLEQVEVNQMVVETEHPLIGTFKQIGIPQKMDQTPGKIEKSPPLLGEHSRKILEEFEFDAAFIDSLIEQQVVFQREEVDSPSGGKVTA